MTAAASIAWWGLAWTVLASGIFAVAQAVTRGLRNAAARQLAWLAGRRGNAARGAGAALMSHPGERHSGGGDPAGTRDRG